MVRQWLQEVGEVSFIDALRRILGRGTRDYYHEVVGLAQETGGVVPSGERITGLPDPAKIETLYRTDPLFWSMVQEYVYGIASDYFIEGGEEEDRQRLEKWCRDKGLIFAIQDGIVDICLHGNFWLELIPDYKNKDLSFKCINPQNIDYIRETTTQNVKLQDDGTFEGYEIRSGMKKLYIRKDRIELDGKTVVTSSRKEPDLRTRIAHFKLFGFGESYLGLSLGALIYKTAIVRLNIADMVGESAFRGGGLFVKLPRDASQQTREELKKDLRNITRRNIFLFDERIQLGTLPYPDIRGQADLLYYFADEMAAGMRVPLCLLMLAGRTARGERDVMAIKFELNMKPLQERLAFQIREQIFRKLWEVWGLKSEIPRIVFAERAPFLKLSKSRRIATLARRGLIRWDPELEKRLRQEEGLPYQFVQKQLDEWINEDKTPVESREVDVEA